MTPAAPKPPSGKFRFPRAILWGWLMCGVLDIIAAALTSIHYGGSPVRMLKGIASALLGPAAQQGGAGIAALGLGMHFFVAFCATITFYALSRRSRFLTSQAIVSGLLWGAIVWFTMNLAVLPLLAEFRGLYLPDVKPYVWKPTWLGLVVHFVCVGLPISLAVRRFAPLTAVGADSSAKS